jgi:hypothetical protein
MSNVAEFIKIREQIEFLAKEIAVLLEQNTAPQSKPKLDEATALLVNLTNMVDNDVQVIAVGRLTRLLGTLQTKVTARESKRRVIKKARPAQ